MNGPDDPLAMSPANPASTPGRIPPSAERVVNDPHNGFSPTCVQQRGLAPLAMN